MSYIEEFGKELEKRLADDSENNSSIVFWASQRLLESYRNGIAAGEKRASARAGKDSPGGPALKAE